MEDERMRQTKEDRGAQKISVTRLIQTVRNVSFAEKNAKRKTSSSYTLDARC